MDPADGISCHNSEARGETCDGDSRQIFAVSKHQHFFWIYVTIWVCILVKLTFMSLQAKTLTLLHVCLKKQIWFAWLSLASSETIKYQTVSQEQFDHNSYFLTVENSAFTHFRVEISCSVEFNTLWLVLNRWASTKENFLGSADNKGAAHLCSLISAFVICILESIISRLAMSEI